MTTQTPPTRLRGVALVRTIHRRTAEGQKPAEIARDLGVTSQYVGKVNMHHWKTADGKPPRVWWKPAPEMVTFDDWEAIVAFGADDVRRCLRMGLREIDARGVVPDGVRVFVR